MLPSESKTSSHDAPHIASERRQASQLYAYWQKLCKDRPYPLEEELDPDELAEIWDDCFLIQLRDIEQVSHYNYTYLGANILHAYESGQLQTHIPGMASLNALHLGTEFRQVMEDGKPFFFEDEHRINALQVVKFRQCLLPLGNHEGKIASILGEMRFRVYEEAQ